MGSASPRIDVVCTCGKGFKEHHSKIKAGEAVKCPACARPVVFDSSSENPNVRTALRAARKFRLGGGEQTSTPNPNFRL